MSFNLDSYLGIQPDALEVDSQRADVLAANVANADTPGYLAKDIDFRAALSAAGQGTGRGRLRRRRAAAADSSPDDLSASSPPNGLSTEQYLKYRVPLAPSLDGNTVDSQMEESAFAENNVRYEAALTFIEGKFSDLNTVISD